MRVSTHGKLAGGNPSSLEPRSSARSSYPALVAHRCRLKSLAAAVCDWYDAGMGERLLASPSWGWPGRCGCWLVRHRMIIIFFGLFVYLGLFYCCWIVLLSCLIVLLLFIVHSFFSLPFLWLVMSHHWCCLGIIQPWTCHWQHNIGIGGCSRIVAHGSCVYHEMTLAIVAYIRLTSGHVVSHVLWSSDCGYPAVWYSIDFLSMDDSIPINCR